MKQLIHHKLVVLRGIVEISTDSVEKSATSETLRTLECRPAKSDMRAIQTISRERFEKYGKVIEFSPGCKDSFEIVVNDDMHPIH